MVSDFSISAKTFAASIRRALNSFSIDTPVIAEAFLKRKYCSFGGETQV
jgi:hypothetical protein